MGAGTLGNVSWGDESVDPNSIGPDEGSLDRRFCSECGTPTGADSLFCPACGSAVAPGGRGLDASGPFASAPLAVPIAAGTGEPAVWTAEDLAPAVPLEPSEAAARLAIAAMAAGIALAVGILSTVGTGALATLRSLDPYLVVLKDLTYAIPVLIGLSAGYATGLGQGRGGRPPSWLVAVAGGLVGAGATLLVGQSVGAYTDPIVSGGWFALGAGLASAALGWLFVLTIAALLALVAWRAGLARRPVSASVIAVCAIVLAVATPMLVRLYHLTQSVGGLR